MAQELDEFAEEILQAITQERARGTPCDLVAAYLLGICLPILRTHGYADEEILDLVKSTLNRVGDDDDEKPRLH